VVYVLLAAGAQTDVRDEVSELGSVKCGDEWLTLSSRWIHFLFCLSSPNFVSSLFFLIPSSPQSGQSPLDVVRTETKKGSLFSSDREVDGLSLTFSVLSWVHLTPPLSSLLLLETVPVALLPSWSLQSESRPTPRRSSGQRAKSESGAQAKLVEEGGRDL
jgi:hypothetical protein